MSVIDVGGALLRFNRRARHVGVGTLCGVLGSALPPWLPRLIA